MEALPITSPVDYIMHKPIGFTLIELTIVIAIVAALCAIAAPSFLDYRSQANDISAHADIKNSIQLILANLKN